MPALEQIDRAGRWHAQELAGRMFFPSCRGNSAWSRVDEGPVTQTAEATLEGKACKRPAIVTMREL